MGLRTGLLLLVCVVIHQATYSQSMKSNGMDRLSSTDYEPGVVWVKLKQKHKQIFENNTTGRILDRVLEADVTPLLNRKAHEKSIGRAAPHKEQIDINLYYKVSFDKGTSVEEEIQALYATEYFELVEPVYTITPFFTPNDPSITQQYFLDLIHAQQAWDITTGDATIIIGIVDTGGDLDHPDLVNNLYVDPADPTDGIDNDGDGYIDNNRGWDFSGADVNLIGTPGFNGDNDPSVLQGNLFVHGTLVAGCASASTDNGIGIAGVGYQTKLLFTKHYADNQVTSGYSSNLYEGILYAATHGAKIINCSWGSYNRSTIAQDIINYVTLDLGCLVVAAAGNSNIETPIYPASYESVFSVASSDESDVRSVFSNFGKTIDIISPGNNILTTTYNDAYTTDSGTSLAAPIVSGAAALVWSKNPAFTPLQVAEQLRVSADETIYSKNPAYLHKLGKGRLDIFEALSLESPSVRARNQSVVQKNGTSPAAGEDALVYFDFTNYLMPTSGQFTVTLSSASPYITISKNEINLGVIPENSTIRNTSAPFEITLSADLPVDQPVEALLTFSDGAYLDFQLLTFVLPSYIDVDENNLITSLTSSGRIGYGKVGDPTSGSGFIYNEESLLYEMGLIMGSAATNLYNNVRSTSGQYDQDFTPTMQLTKERPGKRSFAEISGGLLNDQSAETPLSIAYKSLVWDNDPYRNFVILEYSLKNSTAIPVEDFYFGIFADWDISSLGSGDRASWNNETNTGFVFPAQSVALPVAGIQALSGSTQYYAIDNDQTIAGNPFGLYDGYTDDEKFLSISSGLAKTEAGNPATGNDVSMVVASGPYTINPGDSITIAFALHAAGSQSDLVTSARYADSLYNYTLKAPVPIVELVTICNGEPAELIASGASHFNWYKDFTGGSPVFSGAELITSSLYNDTILFVANADAHYESIRTAAIVTTLPHPEAAFVISNEDASPQQVITFTNTSNPDGVLTFLWEFGDGGTSTEESPNYSYPEAGEYAVTLTATSDEGCQDQASKLFGIITGLEEALASSLSVYPNPVLGATTLLNIFSDESPLEIELLQSTGKRIMKIPGTQNVLEISDLPNGIYWVRITTPEGVVIKKLVIAH